MSTPKPTIAVIGSGIAGMGAAWLLSRQYDVTLFEKEPRIGGHSNTADIHYDGETIPVDTGFIVFNEKTYPNLIALFSALSVPTQKSDMSFGVSVGAGWLEYAGINARSVFATPRHAANPKFWQMLIHILRFNAKAASCLPRAEAEGWKLRQLLDHLRLGEWFRRYYLLPMGGAIWSCPAEQMNEYPAASFLRFFENHGLLSVNQQPQWHTVSGGSREYVTRLLADANVRVRKGAGVRAVRSTAAKVEVIETGAAPELFDYAVIATHGDEALALLADASAQEREILSAFRYSTNRAVLHRDARLMPKRRAAWAAWNYSSHHVGAEMPPHPPANAAAPCALSEKNSDAPALSVTYWMNKLQGINPAKPLFVTLNPHVEPEADKIFAEYSYTHPIFDEPAIRAQSRIQEIQGVRNIYFAGAYQRYGFHEDGLMSAVAVANLLNVRAPWQ